MQGACTDRLNSIKEHDELRYLLRSVERNLQWHRGRIVLVVPEGVQPSWLLGGTASGRLHVITQNELLRRAVASPLFVAAADRGRQVEWAPNRIFNDYPVQAALPFLPNASRVLMLLADDLVFARVVSICDFIAAEPRALRIFARPFLDLSEPGDVFAHSVMQP